MMEERGMVAPSDGTNKPRKVLMSEGQLADYLSGGGPVGMVGAADGAFAGGGDGAAEVAGRVPSAETPAFAPSPDVYPDAYPGVSSDVSGAEIAPVSHSLYGGIPGGEPADADGAYGPNDPDDPDSAGEDIRITDISDLINDDDPPFVTDDE
jgi:hypothetical protein